LEKVDGQRSIVAVFHLAVKHLLYDVVHNVVKEVVPREAEEEVLCALAKNHTCIRQDLRGWLVRPCSRQR
jgi:hypothetical protein